MFKEAFAAFASSGFDSVISLPGYKPHKWET